MTDTLFEHGSEFSAGIADVGIHLGPFEAAYEELFAEVIEDGVITEEERQRLDIAAERMGLDKSRLQQLEAALTAAYEAHHRTKIVIEGELPPQSLIIGPAVAPEGEKADPTIVKALRKRVADLETEVKKLQQDLEQARNNVAIEVDFAGATMTAPPDDPAELRRLIRQDPTDPAPVRQLFRHALATQNADEAFCAASALTFLKQANAEEVAFFEQNRPKTLPRPKAAVSPEGWRRLLFHPDCELLVSDIFSVITSAVLVGRVAALRRDGLVPKLSPERLQDPATSTVGAVRAVGWSAATLGLKPPPIYVDPDAKKAMEMIPAMPPKLQIGGPILSGRSPFDVAFECGRTLAIFREEYFVRWIFPGIPDLEDLFLAALHIAQPALPIPPHAKVRVLPLAAAISPMLETDQIDRLRGHFMRFIEDGGRTNLQRWAHAAEKTACRAGLLLCGDLAAACNIVASDEGPLGDRTRDLLVFMTSDRYAMLRKQLGLAL